MNTYQYQVLRYVPDRVTGEFVNVGLIIYEPNTCFLRAKMLHHTKRVAQFFHANNGRRLFTVLRHIEVSINQRGAALQEPLHFAAITTITDITERVIVPNDAAWQLSPVKRGICVEDSCQHILDSLYHRMVEQYVPISPPTRNHDDEVWRHTYRQYFDRYRLTAHLQPRVVVTANDNIEFQQTWKNGALNCYEAISFDLQQEGSIKDKVYKWFGRLSELHTSSELIHVHLLTAIPENEKLREFVEQKLKAAEGGNVRVDIVHKEEAEAFAERTSRYMEEHSAH